MRQMIPLIVRFMLAWSVCASIHFRRNRPSIDGLQQPCDPRNCRLAARHKTVNISRGSRSMGSLYYAERESPLYGPVWSWLGEIDGEIAASSMHCGRAPRPAPHPINSPQDYVDSRYHILLRGGGRQHICLRGSRNNESLEPLNFNNQFYCFRYFYRYVFRSCNRRLVLRSRRTKKGSDYHYNLVFGVFTLECRRSGNHRSIHYATSHRCWRGRHDGHLHDLRQ